MKLQPFLYVQAKFDGLETFNGHYVDRRKKAVEFYLGRERSYSRSQFDYLHRNSRESMLAITIAWTKVPAVTL